MFPMNDKLTVKRPVRTSDGRGGYVQTYVPVGEYPCRISSPSHSDMAYAGKVQVAIDCVFYTRLNADIQLEDRITCRGAEYIAQAPTINSVQVFKRIGAARVKS
jgi:SPP1 family predicted phage head-tail adaptor